VGRVTGRTCSKWQGLLAMQAVGPLGDDESASLGRHLVRCPSCRQDAQDLAGVAAALRFVDSARVDGLETPTDALVLLHPGQGSEGAARPSEVNGGRRVWAGLGLVSAAVAAGVALVVAFGPTGAPTRTVALTGEQGVRATAALTTQSWGTRVVLQESGQHPGQVLTVSMKAASGAWWVAGSYRTTAGDGTIRVEFSCAVPANEITDVWVSDPGGRTVLNGYLH
jgi:hypothetical protein